MLIGFGLLLACWGEESGSTMGTGEGCPYAMGGAMGTGEPILKPPRELVYYACHEMLCSAQRELLLSTG